MREVDIRVLMSGDKKKTRFTKKIRIDPKQLEYIRAHKGTYATLAGRLDAIINFYKSETNTTR